MAPGRGLACTCTRICSATNLCLHINYKPSSHINFGNLPITIQFQTLWLHPHIMCNQGFEVPWCNQGDEVGSTYLDMKPLASEEMLCQRKSIRWCPSGFIMHRTHSRADLGACASKGRITCWLRSCEGRWTALGPLPRKMLSVARITLGKNSCGP